MAKKTYHYWVLALGFIPIPFGWSTVAQLLSAPSTAAATLGAMGAIGLGVYLFAWARALYRTVSSDLEQLRIREQAKREEGREDRR